MKMKIFFAFIKKEFQHVLRDTRSLVILIGLPVMMMLIFGFALSNEVKESKIAILASNFDETTNLMIDRLHQSHYFSVVEMLHSSSEIEPFFLGNKGRLVVVFDGNSSQKLAHDNYMDVQLIADASDANAANIVINYAIMIFNQFQEEKMNGQTLPYQIKIETKMLYNPQLKSSYNYVPGVMTLILMLLGAMMTSVSIVKEKEFGTMEILLVSPLNPAAVVISKAIPYALLCFVDVIIILLMSRYILDMPIKGSLPLLLAESGLFICTTLSLGLLISNSVKQQQLAMFISLVGLLMPSLVFSGFMFPIENMPLPMQIISNIVPTKWYFNILKNVMIKGLGFSYIWKETLILLFTTLFFLTIAIKKFKIRLD
jgi:ABC-2 type transport system permease protein